MKEMKEMKEMKKVLLFGTHPKQFNGYSKVVYELAQSLSKFDDIELTIFGFQNLNQTGSKHRMDLSPKVKVYDAAANEVQKVRGFGQQEVVDFVTLYDPDVCIIYNDMVVISSIVSELRKIPNPKFKIIGYIDQVYLNQRKMFIDFINKNIDVSILFTKSWEDNIKEQGVKTPTHFLPHGFNSQNYYPIPKHIARKYFNLSMDDFIILNLNRNQPRKRWDICLKAFAEIVSRFPDKPIKLIVGTALQGEWNLIEVFQRELEKRNLTIEDGIKHLIVLDNPQRNNDEEINIMYNLADVGINTCDGEGFGLCNFEQAAVGIPQIVPRLGGFVDFFDDSCAMLMDPQMALYVGKGTEFVGGESLLISYVDVADAIETYYQDKDLRDKHGKLLREKILRDYNWTDIAQKLYDIIKKSLENEKDQEQQQEQELNKNKQDVANLVEEVQKVDDSNTPDIFKDGDSIDTETLDRLISANVVSKDGGSEKVNDTNDEKRNKKRNKKKKKNVSREEVVALQKELANMLNRMNASSDSDSDSE